MVLESILGGLLSLGAAKVGSTSFDRARTCWKARRYQEVVDELAVDMNDALRAEIRQYGIEEGESRLEEIADDWEPVAAELAEIDVVLNAQSEAVDLVADAIERAHGNWDSEQRRLVKQAVAETFSESLDRLLEVVTNNRYELFDAKLGVETHQVVQETKQGVEALRQDLIGTRYYEVYDPEEELDRLLADLRDDVRKIPYVDRPEVHERGLGDGDLPERLLITGRAGTGKTRTLVELLRQASTEELDAIIRPTEHFSMETHVQRFDHEQFEGDVLLVWDDIHRVREDYGDSRSLVETTIRSWRGKLADEGHTLRMLLAGRHQEERLPGDPWDPDESLTWRGFAEPLLLRPREESRFLKRLVKEGLESEFEDLDATEEGIERLVERAVQADPSPYYVVTVLTLTDELTAERVDEFAADPGDIWRKEYERHLREDDEAAADVMLAMKYLYDINQPFRPELVKGVAEHVLGLDENFRDVVERLDAMDWLSIPEGEKSFNTHDLQVAAIPKHVGEDIPGFARFLDSEDLQWYLTGEDVDKRRAELHFSFGVGLALEAASEHTNVIRRQSESAIELREEFPEARYNYALLLYEELDDPGEAAAQYEQAIADNDGEYAEARHNYANLLKNELDDPGEAAAQYKQAIAENDGPFPEAYFNYGTLLEEQGQLEAARDHVEQSVEIWRTQGNRGNAINDLIALVRICEKNEDYEDAVEYAVTGLELAVRADDSRYDEFVDYVLDIDLDPETTTMAAYRAGIECVIGGHRASVLDLFAEAFHQRDSLEGGEPLRRARSAGVAIAVIYSNATFGLGYEPPTIEGYDDPGTIIEDVARRADSFRPPVADLCTLLVDGVVAEGTVPETTDKAFRRREELAFSDLSILAL